MDRRFVSFLALTLLIWTTFVALRVYFAPQPPPAAKRDVAQDQANQGQNKQPAAQEPARPDKDANLPKDAQAAPPPAADAALANQTAPRQRGTLGSLDAHKLLVTWDSRGAAIERVELSAYKSVEDESGYLGNCGLTNHADGGAAINVVGPGTPAALAVAKSGKLGLMTGDVITQIDKQAIADAAALEQYLAKTKPDQKVALLVRRAGAAQPLEFSAKLVRQPLEVVQPESHVYETPRGVRYLPPDPLSLLLTLDNIGGRSLREGESEIPGLPSLHNSHWTVDATGADFVEFSYTLDEAALTKIGKTGALKIVKRYTLAKPNQPGELAYHLDLQVGIHNVGREPQPVAYRLDGPTGLPLEGWWYSTKLHPEMWAGAGARDVAFRQSSLRHRLLGGPKIVSEAIDAIEKKQPPLVSLLTGDQSVSLDYVGVDTQFFASVVLPQPQANNEPIRFSTASALPVQDVTIIPKSRIRTANNSFHLTTASETLAPGANLTHDYRVFFGPKDPHLLADYKLDPLIEYGWRIFAVPAKLLLLVLNGLYMLTAAIGIGNYGIAIILLTVIVRSCMIPISLKQARAAAKMQELAPEVQRIKVKYPDDPMKQHAAVQELYKKHNFNMFSGCLPVFIQLPIFIGLYRCLSVDIDLRDAALIPGISWASNLAGPDKLFYWKDWVFAFIGDEADGWLGPFFNVLPLITVALFLVQQKMFTPPATDEQTRMQQQMMTYMTVFMGVMFYKVPAGLCIYFITSSLWGICERKLLKTTKPSEGGEGGGALAVLPAKPASPNGSTKPSASKRQKQRK